MLRKSFVFILVFTFTCLVTFAQDAPKSDEEPIRKAYSIAIGGSGSYMGVEIKEITKKNFAEMGLSEVKGVGISRVLKDSPAEKAGLQDGDVIVRFNGETVTSTRKLTRLIREVSPDHKANLTVVRNGSEIEIPITMGKRSSPRLLSGNFEFPKVPNVEIPNVEIPEMPEIPSVEVFPKGKDGNYTLWNLRSSRTIGVGVSPLTKQLGEYFGVTDGKGLLVNRVSKDSPAERGGLRAGDVIIEIDGKVVKRSYDLMRHLGEKKEGDVNLTILRDKNRQTITVTPEKSKGGEMFFNGLEFGELNEQQLKEMQTKLEGMQNKLKDLKIRIEPKLKGVSMPLRIQSLPIIL